jgi:hypothetical protein
MVTLSNQWSLKGVLRCHVQQFYILNQSIFVCFDYICKKKRLLYPFTALTDWYFGTEMESVYCAVRTGS